MISLWAGAVYLYKHGLNFYIAMFPATFMSAVSCTYILMASEGLGLSTAIAYPVGIVFAAACLAIFLFRGPLKKRAEGPTLSAD